MPSEDKGWSTVGSTKAPWWSFMKSRSRSNSDTSLRQTLEREAAAVESEAAPGATRRETWDDGDVTVYSPS